MSAGSFLPLFRYGIGQHGYRHSRGLYRYPGEFFDPEQVLQTVENERCTSLYGVPTMFIAELDLPDFAKYNLKSLRTGIMAGAPCPIDTMRKVQSLMNMTEICVCYGMTETSPGFYRKLYGRSAGTEGNDGRYRPPPRRD